MKPKENSEPKLDPVHEAIFEQLNNPEKIGNGHISNKYKALYTLIFILPYLLLNLDILWINYAILFYSVILTFFIIAIIRGFKNEMIHEINPFDVVWFQFILFVNFVCHCGLIYYSLFLISDSNFKGNISETANFFDFIYFSVVTITTVGFGDIYPNSLFVKMVVVYELGFGLWFLVTVIPISISLQAERFFHLSKTNRKINEELQRGLKENRWKNVEDIEKNESKNKK